MDGSRSKAALVEFLDYVSQKGLLAPATAQARKVAVNAVLGILDDGETQDVTVIDLDSAIARFSNLQGKGYTPDSLKTYKSRVKSAISDFANYLHSPMAFKPGTQAREKKPGAKKSGNEDRAHRDSDTFAENTRPHSSLGPMGTSIIPIPIRKDLTVQIYGLPFDLTEAEARKVAAVVQAMASVDA